MKDFSSWHSAIHNAKTSLALKTVGEEPAHFLNRLALFGDGDNKLTDEQLSTFQLE